VYCSRLPLASVLMMVPFAVESGVAMGIGDGSCRHVEDVGPSGAIARVLWMGGFDILFDRG
jgi:hypothetical protein